MFETIYELPSQVRSSLDEADQAVFMGAYNKADPKTEADVKKAMRDAWRACKDLPSSFSFHIIASVEDVDKDREIIGMDSIKDHMDSFIDYGGNIQDDHSSYQLGVIWDWEPIKKEGKPGIAVWGNLFGGDEVYDNARKAFADGTNSLSIAGEAGHGKFQCDEKGCYTRRDVRQLLEISLCKVPANKHCTLQWYNESARLEKSADGFRLGVDSYEVHRDYTTCPIQALKRRLIAKGVEAHAREDGVLVSLPGMREEVTAFAKSLGIQARVCGNGVLIDPRMPLLEKEWRRCYEAGMSDEHGYLTGRVTKSEFTRLWSEGLLIAQYSAPWGFKLHDGGLS